MPTIANGGFKKVPEKEGGNVAVRGTTVGGRQLLSSGVPLRGW